MSKKPVIAVGRKLPKAVEARLKRDYDARLNAEDRLYSTDEWLALLQGADGALPCHSEIFSAEVVARLPESVRIIANYSVGYDHVDTAACKSRGIVVTNTPDVLSDATAEIAMLCLFGAARRASEGDRMVRDGRWKVWSPDFMVGVQITGKRIGIVGMGRVGLVMAARARAFDMEVHYYNRNRLSEDQEKALGATYHASLDSLLPAVDVVSLHCPTTPETRGLMNADRFRQMRDGAILVNTARGALIDEAALIGALKSGKLFAAGLDVFNTEPGGNPALAELDNIFMLPHIGSATFDTRDAMGYRALDNLDAFFAGKEPRDRVA
ncbi:MAG: D-glycerate dehydrogenase [Proteobacteria bacterium]|nr:D-glycerate dehydrogenase [Pseudomonadota bacterium]